MKAHIRKNPSCALCWQPGEHLAALQRLCGEAGLPLTVLDENALTRCVGELCGLPGRYPACPEPVRTDFPEALILSQLTDPELDHLLTALRREEISIPLRAAVTPTNSKWPLCVLLQELSEEHLAIEAQKQK